MEQNKPQTEQELTQQAAVPPEAGRPVRSRS